MRWPGFVGPTYTLRSPFVAMDRCVNQYPELDELHNAKNQEIGSLVARPALKRMVTAGNGPIRAAYYTSTGRLIVVSGSGVYRVGPDWKATLVGTLSTSTGVVSIADNGLQTIFVDGVKGYILTFGDGTFKAITAAGFVQGTRVAFQDGYFIVNNPGTGQYGLSALYDGTAWDPLDFATAEGQPDALISLVSNNRQLWLFGARTIEVWYNVGASDFPFARIDGAYVEIGCGAEHSAVKFADSVAWLSDQGVVYMANGFQPSRVSNHAVEIAVQNCGDFSTTTAWSYLENGHWFYCMNLPGSSTTWVYDLSTGQWHERTSTDSNGVESQWRAGCYAYAYDTHVVGDNTDGRVYSLDVTQTQAYYDDGATITRRRVSTHLSSDLRRVFIHQAQLDVQMGIGLDGTGQGTDPLIMLRMSRDGGFNWDGERTVSAGKIGETRKRAIWRRMGQGRDWVCEVKITDPVRTVILGMEVQAVPGAA